MSKRVRSIKGGMDKAARVEEKALAKAGLRETSIERAPRLSYRDPEFDEMSLSELKKLYQRYRKEGEDR